jgi:thiol:disulfide interchange protein DsbD
MKFLLRNIYLLFIFLCYNSSAQILEPVTWEFETVKVTDTEYELVFTANIDPKWSVYSQDIDGFGPIPTSFEFSENLNIEFIGGVIEDYTNRITEQDPIFDMVVSKFYTKAKFIQKVKIKDKVSPVSGYLTFMTCDDTRCLPPTDIDFVFELGARLQLLRMVKATTQILIY